MSKWQAQLWRTGEDWGFEVDCFKADGVTPVPGISKASFRMGTDEGLVIDWANDTNSATLYFAGTRVTVVVPKSARHGIINDVYDYVVQIEDTEGASSDQLNGTITVEGSLFTEAA